MANKMICNITVQVMLISSLLLIIVHGLWIKSNHNFPVITPYSLLILKLQDINEKFRLRVSELDGIVTQAVINKDSGRPKDFHSHRVPEGNADPILVARKAEIWDKQGKIKSQMKKIASLKIQIESVTSVDQAQDYENQVVHLERENK